MLKLNYELSSQAPDMFDSTEYIYGVATLLIRMGEKI